MGFSRQEHWSGWPRPPPGDLPHPGMGSASPALQVGALLLSHQGSPQYKHMEAQMQKIKKKKTTVCALGCFPEMNLSHEQSKQSLTYFF